MTINLATWKERWPNFEPFEVLSDDGMRAFNAGHLVIQPFAMDFLQEFREKVGRGLIVNTLQHSRRGYRSPRENAQVKGEEFSYHMQGLAFDISSPSIRLEDLRAEAVKFGWHGIGSYPSRSFIHLDLRPRLDDKQWFWEG